jgi:DNA adenine methylase
LVFCDPPYWNTAGYGVEFGFENYEKMAEIMRSMKGKMIVTANDIPEMRECFSGFYIEQLEITYTLGKVKDGKRVNKSCELLIRNF